MSDALAERPRLRDVEVQSAEFRGRTVYLLWEAGDPEPEPVPVTEPGLFIVSRFDGRLTAAEIAAECSRRLDAEVTADLVVELIRQLDENELLHPAVADVPLVPPRPPLPRPPLRLFARDNEAVNRAVMSEILAARPPAPVAGRVAGLIAPHLDYERGRPCYGQAYRLLAGPAARRFVILGTNHFGRSWHRLTASDCDFRTPLGTARNDREFLARLSGELGTDLCVGALDHVREHSVELQVRFLQHMLGNDGFTFVPFLCPDPCGPTGTAPRHGDGADLDDFADALAAAIAADGVPTCVIAGADLAHIGRNFGDEELLNERWLGEVRGQDRTLLDCVADGRPEGIIDHLRTDENARRVCSAGCIYTLCKTLLAGGAEPHVLDYHQAVDHDTQTAVTCAAAVFTQ